MNLEIYFKAELTCDCRNNNNDPQEKCNCETYLDIQHFDIAGVSFLDVVNDMGKFHCPPELFEDELFGIVEKIRDSIKLKKKGGLMERTTHFTKDSKGKTVINSMVVLKEEDYKHLRSLLGECLEFVEWVGKVSLENYEPERVDVLWGKIENELKKE